MRRCQPRPAPFRSIPGPPRPIPLSSRAAGTRRRLVAGGIRTGMADYIEKLRVRASVSMPGREPMTGYFALAPQAEFRLGPETLLERLNTQDRVIPFIR